jgi:uncharacterized protein YndB with AHSA1/START domain
MAHEDPAAPEPTPADDAGIVTRTVEVDADPAEVWEAVADPDERALWLDDPDALARHVRVDESAPGERLVWTWWHPGDEGDASTVSVVLSPADGGGTRVVVTESMTAGPLVGGGGLRASALAGAGVAAGGLAGAGAAGLRPPARVRGASERWDSRLFGLELLFVAARARIA